MQLHLSTEASFLLCPGWVDYMVIFTARKRSFRQGNVFTRLSVHSGGSACVVVGQTPPPGTRKADCNAFLLWQTFGLNYNFLGIHHCSIINVSCIFFFYRSGTVNSNTVNSKFHLIRSYCEYLATILSFYV